MTEDKKGFDLPRTVSTNEYWKRAKRDNYYPGASYNKAATQAVRKGDTLTVSVKTPNGLPIGVYVVNEAIKSSHCTLVGYSIQTFYLGWFDEFKKH